MSKRARGYLGYQNHELWGTEGAQHRDVWGRNYVQVSHKGYVVFDVVESGKQK